MLNWAVRPLPRPNAFIQWKGTNVCMDCYCICGKQFHIDDDFTYAVKCPHCGQVYEMSSMIEMRPLAQGEVWDGCDPREDNSPHDSWDDEPCLDSCLYEQKRKRKENHG